MICHYLYGALFFCSCFIAFGQGQSFPPESFKVLQDGYSSYYDCILQCYQEAFGFGSIYGDFCNSSLHMRGAKGGSTYTLQEVATSLKCITGKCRNIIPESACQPLPSIESPGLPPTDCEDVDETDNSDTSIDSEDKVGSNLNDDSDNESSSNLDDEKSVSITPSEPVDSEKEQTSTETLVTEVNPDDLSDVSTDAQPSTDTSETTPSVYLGDTSPSEASETSIDTPSSPTNTESSTPSDASPTPKPTSYSGSNGYVEGDEVDCEDDEENDFGASFEGVSKDCENNTSSTYEEVSSATPFEGESSTETSTEVPTTTSPINEAATDSEFIILPTSELPDNKTASEIDDDIISSTPSPLTSSNDEASEDDCEDTTTQDETTNAIGPENVVQNMTTSSNPDEGYEYYYYYYYYDDNDTNTPNLNQLKNAIPSNFPNSEQLQNGPQIPGNAGFATSNDGTNQNVNPEAVSTYNDNNALYNLAPKNQEEASLGKLPVYEDGGSPSGVSQSFDLPYRPESESLESDSFRKRLIDYLKPYQSKAIPGSIEENFKGIQSMQSDISPKTQNLPTSNTNLPVQVPFSSNLNYQFNEDQTNENSYPGEFQFGATNLREPSSNLPDSLNQNRDLNQYLSFQRYQNRFIDPVIGMRQSSDQAFIFPQGNSDNVDSDKNRESSSVSPDDNPVYDSGNEQNTDQLKSTLLAALKSTNILDALENVNFKGDVKNGD